MPETVLIRNRFLSHDAKKFHCVVFDLCYNGRGYIRTLEPLFQAEQSEQENLLQVEESEINFVSMSFFFVSFPGFNFINILIS
jgi:hypothetical protein